MQHVKHVEQIFLFKFLAKPKIYRIVELFFLSQFPETTQVTNGQVTVCYTVVGEGVGENNWERVRVGESWLDELAWMRVQVGEVEGGSG